MTPTIEEGVSYQQASDFANARSVYEEILSSEPDNTEALKRLGELYLAQKDKVNASQCRFLLGQIYDECGDYEAAFENYQLANELAAEEHNSQAYSSEIAIDLAKDTILQYSRRYRNKFSNRGLSTVQPIFIVGMPYSGCEIVGNILKNHTDTVGVIEPYIIADIIDKLEKKSNPPSPYFSVVNYIPSERMQALSRYYLEKTIKAIEGEQQKKVVDCTIDNYKNIGMILDLFPNAKIIHVRRDPRETCLSCYSRRHLKKSDCHSDSISSKDANLREEPYFFELKELADAYSIYSRYMDHWQQYAPGNIHHVEYEDLVSEPAQTLKEVLEHAELADPIEFLSAEDFPLLDFEEDRWKNYESHLEGVLKLLSSLVVSKNLQTIQLFPHALELEQAEDYVGAEKFYRKILHIDSKHINACQRLSNLCIMKGEYEEAVELLEIAIELGPGAPEFYNNIAIPLQELERYDDAYANYQQALKLMPDNADAHWNMAMLKLMQGEFKQGWGECEWRWLSPKFLGTSSREKLVEPPFWEGDCRKGLLLNVVAEQGVGDEIMFLSCVPELVNSGVDIVLTSDGRLNSLLSRSIPGLRFSRKQIPVKSGDSSLSRISLGSLPKFLRNSLEEFPTVESYLVADAEKTKAFKSKYQAGTKNKIIGISWSGGIEYRFKLKRSIALIRWASILAVPGTQFVSLQYGEVSKEIEEVSAAIGVSILEDKTVDAKADLDTFASQVAACDLVISIDNSTVHMAGALGIPVWTLLPRVADYRWLLGREDTVWYQSMRLMRQQTRGNWDDVLERIVDELGLFLHEKELEDKAVKAIDLVPAPKLASSQVEDVYNNAQARFDAKEFEEAKGICEGILESVPDHLYANQLLGHTFIELENFEQAIEKISKAITLDGSIPELYNNLALAQKHLGLIEDAIKNYRKAVLLKPDYAVAQWNLSLLEILNGELGAGWERCEWRWFVPEFVNRSMRQPVLKPPHWDGLITQGLELHIFEEQGLGDEMMFASCIPDLLERGVKCTLTTGTRTQSIFARSFPAVTVYSGIEVDESYQLPEQKIAIGSLPKLLRKEPEEFPIHDGYLICDEHLAENYRKQYHDTGDELVVGISWLGARDPKVHKRRSLPLLQWAKLLTIPNIRFVSLQYGDVSAEIEAVSAELDISIVDDKGVDPLKDMDRFAAQMSACDLVISVDNTTVHMAGALGIDVWTLLPKVPDYRWGLDSDESLWYPSMCLFRQREVGNWGSVVNLLAAELKETSALNSSLAQNQMQSVFEVAIRYHSSKQYNRVVRLCRRILARDPLHLGALELLGYHAIEAGRYQEGVEHFTKLVSLAPSISSHHNNYAAAQKELGLYADAIDSYHTTIELDSDCFDAQWHLAQIEIQSGNFCEGWQRNENRWLSQNFVNTCSRYGALKPPFWNGEVTSGMELSIVAEQGIGDELLYLSCLPDLLKDDIKCTIYSDGRLTPLLSRTYPSLNFQDSGESGASVVIRKPMISMGSLPKLYRNSLSEFPDHSGYILADREKVDRYRQQYRGEAQQPIIGISWRGGTGRRMRKRRSTELAEWSSIFSLPGLTFLSLQYGDVAKDIERVNQHLGISILQEASVDPKENMDDYAAQVAACDLVISVDNSTVHTAGALGVRTWSLLSSVPDFRWLLEGDDTPWYPSMRLFRQNKDESWSAVLTRVENELQLLLDGGF